MDILQSLQSNGWALLAIVALLLVVFASLMDWRRARRRDIDAVGFMPWPAITVLASVVALFAGALAMAT